MKNLMEKIENLKGKINPYYEAELQDFWEITKESQNIFDIFSLSFKYGYMQGHKAAVAEIKKKAQVNHNA